jgi:hypothetical protein
MAEGQCALHAIEALFRCSLEGPPTYQPNSECGGGNIGTEKVTLDIVALGVLHPISPTDQLKEGRLYCGARGDSDVITGSHFSAHCDSIRTACSKSRPASVRTYSTFTGEVGTTWRSTSRLASNSRSLCVSRGSESPGMATSISLKR